MRRMTGGFTIIELLVVITVIGILATITFVGFSRYQADTRDSQRSSQATIITEALEKYYNANGEYPGCSAITANASSVVQMLPGVDPKTLVTPQDPTSESNSIKCQDMTTASGPDVFAYVGDGSAACSSGAACLQFTLKYKNESTGTVSSINSRHTTSILTSGNIADLSASPYSFSQINLAWTGVGGAATYNVRYATNATMSSPTTFTPAPTTNSGQVTGLSLGTQYWLQVQPVSVTGVTGTWSNIATATTYTLGTPAPTAVDDSGSPVSQLDVTWANIPNAQSYTLIYNSTGGVDGSGVLTSPTTVAGATSPFNLTGLAAGSTRYFQVRANASGYSSGYSSVTSATTVVPVPTGVNMTVTSSNTFYASWNASSGATSYNVQYSFDGGSTWNTAGSTSTLQYNFGPGAQEGQQYYVRVQAAAGSATSNWSSSANGTTPIDAPAPYTVSSVTSGYYLDGTSNAVCPSGTTANYIWYANGSLWVQGPSYQTVGYYTDYGQSNTITVTTQCYRGSVYGNGTAASNSATWSRGAPATPPGVSMGGITRGQVQPCASGYWVMGCSGNYYSASVQLNYAGGCTDTTTYYNINVSYNYGGPNGTNYNRTEWVRWYYIQPTSGYIIKFYVQNWCQAADGVQSGAGANQACIANPSNSTACF